MTYIIAVYKPREAVPDQDAHQHRARAIAFIHSGEETKSNIQNKNQHSNYKPRYPPLVYGYGAGAGDGASNGP